jgi:hypothetical protein
LGREYEAGIPTLFAGKDKLICHELEKEAGVRFFRSERLL